MILAFRDGLRKIWESELVRSDEKAQRIILRMVGASMSEIGSQIDLLTLRIGELLATKSGNPTMINRVLTHVSARGKALNTSSGRQHALSENAIGERTRLRL